MDKPRKDKAPSNTIIPETASNDMEISGRATFGINSIKMMRHLVAPKASAARTNSHVAKFKVFARAIRIAPPLP